MFSSRLRRHPSWMVQLRPDLYPQTSHLHLHLPSRALRTSPALVEHGEVSMGDVETNHTFETRWVVWEHEPLPGAALSHDERPQQRREPDKTELPCTVRCTDAFLPDVSGGSSSALRFTPSPVPSVAVLLVVGSDTCVVPAASAATADEDMVVARGQFLQFKRLASLGLSAAGAR